MGNHLRNLGKVTVPLQPDEGGYIGRECPKQDCLGYFKVTLGPGIKGPAPCHCPYCGHTGDQNSFFTQEQIEYGRSVAIRKVMDAFTKDLKSLEFEYKPTAPFGIGISMKVRPSAPYRSGITARSSWRPPWSATTAPCATPFMASSAGAPLATRITLCRSCSRTSNWRARSSLSPRPSTMNSPTI